MIYSAPWDFDDLLNHLTVWSAGNSDKSAAFD